MQLESEIDREAGHVQIAPRLRGWARVVVIGTVGGYRVRLDVEGTEAAGGAAGRFVCRVLTVDDPATGIPVTTEGLRSIPVATILADQARGWVFADHGGEGSGADLSQLSEEDYEAMRADGPTPRTLDAVAATYRLALVVDGKPTLTIEQTFGVPKPTAGRWVALARQRGHLGPAEGPGKAGG